MTCGVTVIRVPQPQTFFHTHTHLKVVGSHTLSSSVTHLLRDTHPLRSTPSVTPLFPQSNPRLGRAMPSAPVASLPLPGGQIDDGEPCLRPRKRRVCGADVICKAKFTWGTLIELYYSDCSPHYSGPFSRLWVGRKTWPFASAALLSPSTFPKSTEST